MRVEYGKYRHTPTLLFFKIDVNRSMRYLHVDLCVLGRGREVWLYDEKACPSWVVHRHYY